MLACLMEEKKNEQGNQTEKKVYFFAVGGAAVDGPPAYNPANKRIDRQPQSNIQLLSRNWFISSISLIPLLNFLFIAELLIGLVCE